MINSELRVVLLEDSPDDLDLIQEFLADVSSVKFTIASFEMLSKGIEYLAHHDADVVLSDLGLLDSQGLSTLDRLLANVSHLPVIVLTGLHDEQAGIEAVRMGAQDYLVKDEINSAVIYRTIIYAIQRFQMEQELRQHRDNLEELVDKRTAELRQEIEQRKRVETALQASESRFRSVTENSLAGIYLIQDGRFQYVNPALAEIFGYQPDEIIGKMGVSDLVAPADKDLVKGNLRRRIDGEIEVAHYVLTGQRKNGEIIYCEVMGKRIDYDGQPAIIGTLVDVTDRIRAEEAEREQRALAETLRETITTLASHLDPDQVMEQIINNIGRVVSHDVSNIMLIEGDEAYVAYCHGYSPEQEQQAKTYRFPLEIDSFRNMVKTRQPCLIEDTTTYAHWQTGSEQVRSYLGTPIIVTGHVIGFINLNSTQPGFFTSNHAERLQIFAQQAAIAVRNAGMYDQIRHNAAEMRRLQQATTLLFTSLSSSQSLTDLAQCIAEAIVESFHLVDAGILLIDREKGQLERLARVGQDHVDTTAPLFLNGPGLVTKAIHTNQMVYVADVTREPDYCANDPDTRSELVIPLATRNGTNTVGVLDLQSPEYDAFSESDIETLKAFAERAAVVIENMQLSEAVLLYATGLEEDVVERTAQLQRLNQRMSAILNNTSDAIILADADGLIDITNLAFDEQFGYRPDELFGQPLALIADPFYREEFKKLRQHVLADGNMCRKEIVAMRKDGTTFEAEIALSQVRNSENYIVCSLHDISHLKAVDRMKDKFISTVSHELRTPITVIVLLVEALSKYYERMTEEQVMKRVDQLRTQSNVLSEMVESILDISRLEMREQKHSTDAIDMGIVVAEVINELQPSAIAKKQTVKLITGANSAIVLGEQQDFARVWRNLINNAIKYTPEGGRIDVRMQSVHNSAADDLRQSDFADQSHLFTLLHDTQQGYVIGQVEDTGYGIRPEDFESLFKRFDRGWAKESNIPGTGLGLPLVRELLAIYGGDIYVSSEVNHGSVFTFWIPIEEETNQ